MTERYGLSGYSTPRWSVTGGLLAALTTTALMASCDSHAPNPELQWGWVTNCAGPEFSKFGGPGPGPELPVFRITDQLVVAVPKKNRPNAGSIDQEPRECRQISDLPPADHLEFIVQGDWSAGYDLADVPTVEGGLKEFRPDSVWVRVERQRLSTLSPEDQRKMDQVLRESQQSLYVGTREIGGLTCLISKYQDVGMRPYCSGHRSPGDSDVTKVTLKLDTPNTHFILIQADYSSLRYGGIHVYWQTWTSEASHWREIEAAIFKSLADWNLVNTTKAQTGR